MSTPASETINVPASDRTPVLETRDVAVHYGGIKAVDGVSVSLQPGLIYGIIGPNGSGKSTLIGAITRMVDLSRGELLLNGVEYARRGPDQMASLGVARTFQNVRLLPDLDVRQNVRLGADARQPQPAEAKGWRTRRAERTALVAELLQRAGLQGLGSFYPSELSYGTQRRVEIARALTMAPQLLLLDEPMAGMNKSERDEISELLRSLKSQGLCQLLVEHDVQVMIDTCDYIYAMNSGVLIAEGPPSVVVQDPRVQEAYLGRKWGDRA